MSFKDYRKFANRNNNQNQNPEVIQNNEDVNENANTEDINVDEIVNEEKPADITTKGVVSANKLNVRVEANKDAKVLTIVSKGTSLGINLTKSTDKFYCVNVIVNGEMTVGYCMKEFVTINE